MADFDEILKKSLTSVAEGFLQAQRDLYRTVESLSTSIRNNAGAEFIIEIKTIAEDLKGVSYRITFDPDPSDIEMDYVSIADLRIPAKGYPVLHGAYQKSSRSFVIEGELDDAKALVNYFADLLSNPDSRLMQAIGFAVRRKGPSPAKV